MRQRGEVVDDRRCRVRRRDVPRVRPRRKARKEMPERDLGAWGRLDESRVGVDCGRAGVGVGWCVWPFVVLSWFVVGAHDV